MRQVRRPFNICFYLYFLLAALFRQVLNSVCSPGWPLTCSPPTFTYVALASSGSSPGSTSRLLGLFVCATTSDFILLSAERSLDLQSIMEEHSVTLARLTQHIPRSAGLLLPSFREGRTPSHLSSQHRAVARTAILHWTGR